MADLKPGEAGLPPDLELAARVMGIHPRGVYRHADTFMVMDSRVFCVTYGRMDHDLEVLGWKRVDLGSDSYEFSNYYYWPIRPATP